MDEHSAALRQHLAGVVEHFRRQTSRLKRFSWQARHDMAQEMFRHYRVLDDMYKFGKDGYPGMSDALYATVPHLRNTKKDLLRVIKSLCPKRPSVVHIGENDFVFLKDTYYQYRYLTDTFFVVDENDLFALLPKRTRIAPIQLQSQLRKIWETHARPHGRTESFFDRFMQSWTEMPSHRLRLKRLPHIFPRGVTTARKYVSQLEKNIIQKLIPLPNCTPDEIAVILQKRSGYFLENYRNNLRDNLEDTTRILSEGVEFVRYLRRHRKGYRRVYFMRDVLAHYIIDRLIDVMCEKSPIRADNFFLKRDMMTKPGEKQYYFAKFMRVIYDELDQMARWDFPALVKRINARMPLEAAHDQDMHRLLLRVGELLQRDKIFSQPEKPITLIDTGFRGSIPLTIIGAAAYLKARRKARLPRLDADLYLSGLIWADIFAKRTFRRDTSYMWAAERLYCAEYLFNYKPRTFFQQGGPSIVPGPRDVERLCLVEFIILVMMVRFLKRGPLKV